MNQIIKSTAVFLGSALLFSGCIEETFPESGYATGGQISDSPFAQDGVVSAMPTILITSYIDLGEHIDFGYPGMLGANDRMAGEVFPVSGNMPGGNQYYDRWQPWLYPCNSTGLDATGYTNFFYNNYYKFIYSANEAISLFSQSEAARHNLGVSKVFRALCYLDMARLYDPLPAKAPEKPSYETDVLAVAGLTVPIVVEGMSAEELENNPRATREEMFTFIFEDLDDAEDCLSDYAPATKNLPSLAVVYGLKARAYLWLGGFEEQYENIPTGEAAYKLAAEYARKAIDASGASITTEAQWLDKTMGFNTVISSWMWAMIQSTDTVLNNLLSWTAHMSPDAVWGYGNGAQPGISVFSYDRIASGDFRKKIFVNGDRDYAAISPYMNLTEAEFNGEDGAMGAIAPYTSFKFHTNGGEKRNFTVGNVTSIPLMRVEEMYLIEAEAKAHYDAAEGRSLLQSFMAARAAGYTVPAGNDLVEEIIFQKRIEFWGEGIILYDLKRLNMSMHNGDNGTNAPSMAQLTTDGRAPWWNCVIPLSAVQQNKALLGKNNPNGTYTYKSVK
ncbi:MAG: RagB/SusD family nutrient uptake outer membrane protein [Alistipes sp.]|nr:RagB/SusD family nutrient uptake outer membrane protein [Alistipes senegalensis]MCM1249683.1 RagB/SusD family nutrient uptake outer membrane protein [Alistipes sp.]